MTDIPYPAYSQPAPRTVPAAAARMVAPGARAKSMPWCAVPQRGPKHDVMAAPGIGSPQDGLATGGAVAAAAGAGVAEGGSDAGAPGAGVAVAVGSIKPVEPRLA